MPPTTATQKATTCHICHDARLSGENGGIVLLDMALHGGKRPKVMKWPKPAHKTPFLQRKFLGFSCALQHVTIIAPLDTQVMGKSRKCVLCPILKVATQASQCGRKTHKPRRPKTHHELATVMYSSVRHVSKQEEEHAQTRRPQARRQEELQVNLLSSCGEGSHGRQTSASTSTSEHGG